MKRNALNKMLSVLYAVGLVFVLGVFVTGLPYYALPLAERPHSVMHDQLKPAGVWGHGVGVVGSAMILLLLLYSVRKRGMLGIRFGRLCSWLDVHIFFGVMGPLLITLHTAMKFHGIVSISYFSMLAVAVSGVFGRYIYMQIPRDARGHALGLENARIRIAEIKQSLAESSGMTPEVTRILEEFAAAPAGKSKIRGIATSIRQDIALNRRARRLRRRLTRGAQRVAPEAIGEVIDLARESSLLQRRIAFLDSMSELFHYWHVFHKPFAYIMLIIMIVHVGVTVAFGYKWVF